MTRKINYLIINQNWNYSKKFDVGTIEIPWVRLLNLTLS